MINSIPSPPCIVCKHFKDDKAPGYYCKAFPEGIPEAIIYSENKHTKLYPGQDNNIIFEPIKESE